MDYTNKCGPKLIFFNEKNKKIRTEKIDFERPNLSNFFFIEEYQFRTTFLVKYIF